ncbi:MAG: XdhC family protein [Siphonobacter sp.]
MKEIKAIIDHYSKLDFAQTRAALATVVRVEGSSYRRVGARMLITEDGQWIGGISGGCLEGDALKRARLAMSTGKASLITYDTTDDDPYQIGVGLGCNGIIDVLFTSLNPQNPSNAVLQLKPLITRRQPSVLLTIVESSVEMLPLGTVFRFEEEEYFQFPVTEWQPPLFEAIYQSINDEKSSIYTFANSEGEIKILLEVILPPIHLLIHGGNYDVFPMVRLASEIGWITTVFCNPQKINKILFKWATAVVPKETNLIPDTYSAAILMAHDFETDYRNYMRYLTLRDVPYIGLLGPRKRFEKMIKRAEKEGIHLSDEHLTRTYSPAGLDTGAATPEEIDLSILAEIRSVFSHREGGQLRKRPMSIYGQ